MRNLFANMDLYKGIILSSVVLFPAACGFAYWVDTQIRTAQEAIVNAEKRGGEIERIALLQKQLDTIDKATRDGAGGEGHALYFERCLTGAASQGITRNDFTIGNEEGRKVGKPKSIDQEVDITFKRGGKDLPLPRAYINAMLHLCESKSKVWKLRQLRIRNAEVVELGQSKQAPPKTVRDDWKIEKLMFVRREPDK
jgi:hypothetical protein